MATSSGAAPHRAWLQLGGQRLPILDGSVNLNASRESSTFSASFPMSLPGAEEALANADSLDATISVEGAGGSGTLLTGELDSGQFDYIGRQIHVSGRCKSSALHAKKTFDKWINRSAGEIIEDLAQRAGLQAQVSVGQTKAGRKWGDDYVKLTGGISIAGAIHKLTELMGARWWVDGNGTLHVASYEDQRGVFTVFYQSPILGTPVSDALGLSVSRNYQAGKTIEVVVKSWNQKKKKAYEGKESLSGSGGTSKFEYEIAGLEEDQAKEHAKARAKEHASHELRVSAKCVGDPSCAPGMALQLIGTPFAQSFAITGVTHNFGVSGYTMTINASSGKDGRA